MKNITRREFVKNAALGVAALGLLPYGNVFAAGRTDADLVVCGKVFTSEGNRMAEAFAVKDGRYVYVGDKQGAAAFVEKGKTEVVDYTGKGLVMPSCGNGHAHYLSAYAVQSIGTMIAPEDDVHKFLAEIVPYTVKRAKETGTKAVYGMGWKYQNFKDNMPVRQQLDAICSDIPMYFADEENHKALVNTHLLVKAGIMKEDGTVLKKGGDIRGGEIVMGADGTPSGFLKEQAATYVRSFLDNESLFTVDMATKNMVKMQNQLLSEGYTMYLDGYSTYFFNDNYYRAARQFETSGNMNFILGLTHEIDSWMNLDDSLRKAAEAKKFTSARIKPNWIRLFMDGTAENGMGLIGRHEVQTAYFLVRENGTRFIEPPYFDARQGISNWSEEELAEITRKANANGITMHVQALGNKGVNRVVNAYIKGGKKEMRNTIVHLRNVNPGDYKRIAENNIYVTSGMPWHHNSKEIAESLKTTLPKDMADQGYPMKPFFDNGVPVSFHTDFPAPSNSPDDPFGMIETALTGIHRAESGSSWRPEEPVTREQALTAMTIGCARQMFLENERGSIKTG
ncbi:MAG: amidohydrolase family protein, partial [Selenomonadaceae bacterium]|nr:amidohydrolase family protein [Selenomonadaceae bacterium]